jgi:hypothetical protein
VLLTWISLPQGIEYSKFPVIQSHVHHARTFNDSVSWKSSKKKKKETKKKGSDLYALLGLKNERFLATPNQLKNGETARNLAIACGFV